MDYLFTIVIKYDDNNTVTYSLDITDKEHWLLARDEALQIAQDTAHKYLRPGASIQSFSAIEATRNAS